jgi:hypothetical protein
MASNFNEKVGSGGSSVQDDQNRRDSEASNSQRGQELDYSQDQAPLQQERKGPGNAARPVEIRERERKRF